MALKYPKCVQDIIMINLLLGYLTTWVGDAAAQLLDHTSHLAEGALAISLSLSLNLKNPPKQLGLVRTGNYRQNSSSMSVI